MKKSVLIISLLACLRVSAQTCTGGLGDPIVDITFGQGTGPGPALAPGITNMTYQTASCPEDGYYIITSQSSNCYQGSWWNVPQDHTGNPNGYFMLINASYQPSDFFVDTVKGLCPGTSYQFAAWILNMVATPNEILPNITFRIENTDGTVLQTFGTGNIPEANGPLWVQYAFYFNTPPGVSNVVLRMTNNAPGGIGNDLALDDITFRAAGPTIQASIFGYPADTVSVCANDQPALGLDAVVESCYPTQVEQWQQSTDSGSTWANIPGAAGNSWNRPLSAPGSYLYRLTVAQSGNLGNSTCQVVSAPIAVDILPVPTPGVTIADSASAVCANAAVTFTAAPVGGGPDPAYQWTVNGLPVGTGSAVLTTSFSTAVPQAVACTMTSDDVCAVNPVAQSNTLSISVIPIPVTGVSIASSATQICQDSMVTFTATPSNGGPAPAYQWQVNGMDAGAAGTSAVFPDSGLQNGDVVSCVMTGSLVCSLPVTALQPITMTIYPLPGIVLDSSTIIAGGSSVELQPVISGDIGSVTWTPAAGLSNATVATPVASPAVTTAYTLHVVTVDGCFANATEDVKVFYDLKMPAAFTPNGDGHNDVFRVPPLVPVSVRRFAVYNRQGAMVFYTENVAAGWDGTFNGQPQPAGVYVWMIEYEDPVTKTMEAKKGTVVLVR